MVEGIPELLLQDFKYDDEDKKYGAQAWVVKGTHPRFKGDVAIKTWTKAYNENEVELLTKRIKHGNIIQLLGILINKQSKYIGYIMPYMTRGNLTEVIHNLERNHDDIYTSEQITSWITQICLGLNYLHSNNIIHRDIKPSNSLLGESLNDLKLSDFGMARSLDDIRSLTKGIGTLAYMAPEMLSVEDYDISVDIYSLSVTIWEILYRRVPFDHVITQRHELSTKIINGERPELGNELSEQVADLLRKCWHNNFSQRPTIDEVLQFSKNTGFQLPEKQTVLLVGGCDGSRLLGKLVILQNNGENQENWKKISIELPCPVWLHGAQFLKNNLYIFGGQNANKETLESTYKLSKRLKWEKMADMNQKRERISNSNLILNDRIWVLGGRDQDIPLKSVEMYDQSKNKWKYMKRMNQCRSGAAAAVVNGKIFCCGGGNGKTLLKSIECYDPYSDVWTFISNMPLHLEGHDIVAMDGNLIVIGGCNRSGESRSVWELDTSNTNAEWIEKSGMSLLRSYFSIARIDDKIFVCEGESEEERISDVEIFDGEVWMNGPKLPTRRSDALAIVIPANFAKYFK